MHPAIVSAKITHSQRSRGTPPRRRRSHDHHDEKKRNMATKKAPWKSPNPKTRSKHSKLNASQKAAAKARAEKAGRRYPNLVDNMWAARQKPVDGSKNPAPVTS